MKTLRPCSAFTLIELLVVVAVVAVLAGMLLPALSAVKTSAQASRCAGQFRQIGVAVMRYAEDWEGVMPWSYLQGCAPPAAGYAAGATGAWCDDLMVGAYLDGQGQSVMGGTIASSSSLFGGVWRCPVDRVRKGGSARGVSFGLNLLFFPEDNAAPLDPAIIARCRPLGRLRRSSEVVMGAETTEPRWGWFQETPADWPMVRFHDQGAEAISWGVGASKPYHTWARHRRGTNLLFADGHIEWRSEMTSAVTKGSLLINTPDWP